MRFAIAVCVLLVACGPGGGAPVAECDVPMALPDPVCVEVGQTITTTIELPCPDGCADPADDQCSFELTPSVLGSPGATGVFTVSPSSTDVPLGQTLSIPMDITGVSTGGQVGAIDGIDLVSCHQLSGFELH